MFSMLRSCFVATLVGIVVGNQGGFRGREASADFLALSGRNVDSSEVRATLQEALDSVFSVGSAGDRKADLQRVEKLIENTFHAMPQTSAGRLGPQAVRHVMRTYFLKNHGWTVFGLEENFGEGNRSTPDMLQARVPALMEAVLEAREHGQGLTRAEVAGLVTALERLIFDESVKMLHFAYQMNGFDANGDLTELETKEVLVSYVALFKIRNKSRIVIDPPGHARWKQSKQSKGELVRETDFVVDSMGNFDFSHEGNFNPFARKGYSFDSVAQIVDSMARKFGNWQDNTCKVLRGALESMDKAGNGRVPLREFWALNSVSIYSLTEPVEVLREIEALDESIPGHPTVRIPNYVVAETQCGHFSEYFDVCCQNACHSIMEELEGIIQAPSADPEQLLLLVANMSAGSDADLDLHDTPLLGAAGQHMRQSLRAIAQRHGGKVPLHGRSFATWLHFAFPRDCPLPLKQRAHEEVTAQAMKEIAPQEWASDMEFQMPLDKTTWVEDDIQVFKDLEIVRSSRSSQLRTAVRLLAMLGAATAILSIGWQHCKAMLSALRMDSRGKKDDDFELPLRF